MPNDKDISYLLDNINRKCVLVAQDAVCPKCKTRMSNKALSNIDSIMADVEKIRGRIDAHSPTNTQTKNTKTKGQQA